MGDWREIHYNNFEGGFYDQDDRSESTIPNSLQLYCRHDPDDNSRFNEAEADAKDKELGHPEVFEGRYSAVIMWTHSTGSAVLVSDKIYYSPNLQTKVRASYMHVTDAQASGGARLGMVFQAADPFNGELPHLIPSAPGDEDPFSDSRIAWGEKWATTRDTEDRAWVTLESPEFTSQPGYMRYVLQANNDYAIPGNYHFDAVSVVQEFPDSPTDPPVDPPVDPPIPPASGPWTVTITDASGAVILQEPFQAVNARIRALAQEIVDLS